jgi:predicted GTPase
VLPAHSNVPRDKFINRASGSNMKIGHSLRSCTAKVEQSDPFAVNGQQVVLLDTPGFDDTKKDDGDILEEIADYLKKA